MFPFIPRVDTRPIAEALVAEYGSLPSVLSAGFDELRVRKGMTDKAAYALVCYGKMLREYLIASVESRIWLGNASHASAFVRLVRDSLPRADYLYLLMDEKNYYVDRIVFDRNVDAEGIEDIYCHVLGSKVNSVILVRLTPWHPERDERDLEMAKRFMSIFDRLSVFLVDVLVVGANESYSYRAADVNDLNFGNIAERLGEINRITQFAEEYDPYS